MGRVLATTAVLAATALVGCGGGGGDKSSHGYPKQVEKNFISSCTTSSGGKKTACTCAMNKIEEQVTFDQFKKDEAEYKKTGKLPADITSAIQGCKGK